MCLNMLHISLLMMFVIIPIRQCCRHAYTLYTSVIGFIISHRCYAIFFCVYITMYYIIYTFRVMWWRYFCVVWWIPDSWCWIKLLILSHPLSWPSDILLLWRIVLTIYHNIYVSSWRIDLTTHNSLDTHLGQRSTAHTTIPASVYFIVQLKITPPNLFYLQPCRNTGLDCSGSYWTVLDWTGRTGLDWARLSWAGLVTIVCFVDVLSDHL